MERLILLHDEAIQRQFEGVEAYPFHYRVNTPALVFFVALGLAIIACGAALWHVAPLPRAWNSPVAGAVGAVGALVAAWAMHWRWVAKTSFIAFTERHLFVGDHKRAWRVERSLLDAASLGFDRMVRRRLLAQLELRVGGQQIPLLIFHPIAVAKDIETLTASLLAHIDQGEPEITEEAADGADRVAVSPDPEP